MVGIILPIINYFSPSDPAAPKKTTNFARPSPWLQELMCIFTWIWTAMMPAGLVSPVSTTPLMSVQIDLTNRFERNTPVSLSEASPGPGEPVLVVRGHPVFPPAAPGAPRFSLVKIGIASYTLALCILLWAGEVYKNDKQIIDMIVAGGSTLTFGLTLIGIAGGALAQGRWKEWWGYYEQ
jgi:hypothetical protein